MFGVVLLHATAAEESGAVWRPCSRHSSVARSDMLPANGSEQKGVLGNLIDSRSRRAAVRRSGWPAGLQGGKTAGAPA